MKKAIVVFFVIIISNILFSKDYKKSKIVFKKNIISDDKLNLRFYGGGLILRKGPFFINDTKIIFYQITNENIHKIFFLNIDNMEKEDINLKSNKSASKRNFTVDKIDDNIYIGNYVVKYKLIKQKLEIYNSEHFHLIDDFYFNYQKGIFKKRDNQVIVDTSFFTKKGSSVKMFITPPILNKNDKNNIYWLSRSEKYQESYMLRKYDIERKKIEIIFDGVFCYSIIPNDSDYLLIFAEGSEYHLPQEYFPGDFIIIKNNGEIVKKFDIEHYDLNKEFFIHFFDINKNNEIIAIGNYVDYLINSKDSNYQREQKGLLLLKLIIENNNKLSTNKNIYYTPTVNNLRFRVSPDLKGKFIRSLNKGEKLELIEKGKAETIQGTKGTWVKVRTEKGEEGWCFDAYLEEVKN